jgi:hypothetical protein
MEASVIPSWVADSAPPHHGVDARTPRRDQRELCGDEEGVRRHQHQHHDAAQHQRRYRKTLHGN